MPGDRSVRQPETHEQAIQEPVSGYTLQPAPADESAFSEELRSPDTELSQSETVRIAAGAGATGDAWWSAPSQPVWSESPSPVNFELSPLSQTAEIRTEPSVTSATGVFFAGDTSFFSLNNALQAIGREKLTGIFRAFWTDRDTIELIARDGEVILVTSRNPQLYCPEAPITLVNIDAEQIEKAREQQRENGCPVFLALAQEELIMREPALQLVQHYGQKLFAQLWTAKRFGSFSRKLTSCPTTAGASPLNLMSIIGS